MKNKNLQTAISFILSAAFALSSLVSAYAEEYFIENDADSTSVAIEAISENPLNDNILIDMKKSKDNTNRSIDFENADSENIRGNVANYGISPMSLDNNGFYQSFTGYITEEGESQWLTVELFPGEVLHCQLDVPNSSQLDYDLYLYETTSDFSTILAEVDSCGYGTYLNGNRSLSEAVGIVNTSSSSKYYAMEVNSYYGSSSTLPFTLHVGINSTYDSWEADENVYGSVNLTLATTTGTAVNTRSLDTLIDNDWYFFTVPNNLAYDSVNLSLDSTSTNAGYVVEVYSEQQGFTMYKESTPLSLSAGDTYLIRVTAEYAGYLTGSNYTLNITPRVTAPVVTISSITGFDRATYAGMTLYRVNQDTQVTIRGKVTSNGIPVANATVNVVIENLNWSEGSSHKYKEATVTTDSSGNYVAYITTGKAMGAFSEYLPAGYYHYFDVGAIYATCGNSISDDIRIFVFAYSKN